jgi:hypothetical protein
MKYHIAVAFLVMAIVAPPLMLVSLLSTAHASSHQSVRYNSMRESAQLCLDNKPSHARGWLAWL